MAAFVVDARQAGEGEVAFDARRLVDEAPPRISKQPDPETTDATEATSNFVNTNFECAFLDVTEQQRTSGRDVVDLYELWARVSRLSERALAVFETASTRRPSEIAPGIFLGGVLEANAKHTLLSLGITHVLNCAKDEIPHDAHEGTFVYEGVRGIRDVSSRENAEAFRKTFTKISAFLADGGEETNDVADVVNDDETRSHETKNTKNTKKTSGGVLVHCFEGKSRSATAVAQHLIRAARDRPPGGDVAFHRRETRTPRPNFWFTKALEAFANESATVRVDGASLFQKSRRSRRSVVSLATTRMVSRSRRGGRKQPGGVEMRRRPCGVSALSGAPRRAEHRDMYA